MCLQPNVAHLNQQLEALAADLAHEPKRVKTDTLRASNRVVAGVLIEKVVCKGGAKVCLLHATLVSCTRQNPKGVPGFVRGSFRFLVANGMMLFVVKDLLALYGLAHPAPKKKLQLIGWAGKKPRTVTRTLQNLRTPAEHQYLCKQVELTTGKLAGQAMGALTEQGILWLLETVTAMPVSTSSCALVCC